MSDRRPSARRATGPRGRSGPFLPGRAIVALAMGGVGLVSCDDTSFVEPEGGRIENLVVRLAVEPDTVRAGDRFSAVTTLRNPSGVGVVVDLTEGCLGEPSVFGPDDHLRPRFDHERTFHLEGGCQFLEEGSTWADADGAESYSIPPGDSLVQRWTMRAWQWDASSAPPDSQAPVPGPHVIRLGTRSTLPTLDAVFEVLGSGYYWNMMRCGFVEPNLQDTLVVDVQAPEAIAGLYNHPFRVYNHTDRDILLQRISSNGPEGGEPYRFRAIIERLTPEGEWEHHSTDFNPWDGVHPLLLRSGECIQAWNPVAINSLGGPGPPGTYRMKLEYSFESHAGLFAYSDPVVVPEG